MLCCSWIHSCCCDPAAAGIALAAAALGAILVAATVIKVLVAAAAAAADVAGIIPAMAVSSTERKQFHEGGKISRKEVQLCAERSHGSHPQNAVSNSGCSGSQLSLAVVFLVAVDKSTRVVAATPGKARPDCTCLPSYWNTLELSQNVRTSSEPGARTTTETTERDPRRYLRKLHM